MWVIIVIALILFVGARFLRAMSDASDAISRILKDDETEQHRIIITCYNCEHVDTYYISDGIDYRCTRCGVSIDIEEYNQGVTGFDVR